MGALIMSLELEGKGHQVKEMLSLKDSEENKSPLEYLQEKINLNSASKEKGDQIMTMLAKYT